MITNNSYFEPCRVIEDGNVNELSSLIEGFKHANKSAAKTVLIFVDGEYDEYFKGELINDQRNIFKQRF